MSKRNELRDDIYQRMHGFKTVKRGYRKDGQSKWYYIDPRGAHSVEDMKEIDVPSENAPNPKLNDILADDMQKNPQDYYIWRTVGDDKVRSAHAEREGEIFNWHVPPTGGHPGEDYNCRCWAEPYKPERYADKPMIVDVSGLDMFKELQKTLKPADLNTKNFPQYAANDKTNAATDAVYTSNSTYAHRKVKFRSPEEEKLLKRIAEQIVGEESYKDFSYLDSSGFITVGKGQLVHDWNTFNAVHWLYNGRPATEDEKRKAYQTMLDKRTQLIIEEKNAAIKEKRKERNPFNKIADYYAGLTQIYITEDEADYLMYSHLQRDYSNLKHYLPEIDNAPEAAQDVAFDIQYNPGITDNTWTYFKRYFNERNVAELAKQVHRNGISESRNNRMRDKILSIKKW